MPKLTVKDLFDKKGKVKLTELYVTNALEAYAAEQAGIDIQIVSFKKDTLRTFFLDIKIISRNPKKVTMERLYVSRSCVLDVCLCTISNADGC